jgi:ribosomal protection tetracycline resistance protein
MSFQKAIEETVYETLKQGLYGWEVGDIVVTLTATGFASPVSAAGDFRNATPLVLGAALKQAGTRVYEPIYAFTLELPVWAAGHVLARLAQAHGVVESHTVEGVDGVVMTGRISAREVQAFRQQLPELTGGRGVMFTQFSGYEPFLGSPPSRPRTGANPYDREQYMLHKLGRVQHEGHP